MVYVAGWICNLPKSFDSAYLEKILDPLDIAFDCRVGYPEELYPLDVRQVFSGDKVYLMVNSYNHKQNKETLKQTVAAHIAKQNLGFEIKESGEWPETDVGDTVDLDGNIVMTIIHEVYRPGKAA